MEQNLDVHVPQILAEIVGEPLPQEPAVDGAKVLSQERGRRERMAVASEDTEPVRRSPPIKKAECKKEQQEQPKVTEKMYWKRRCDRPRSSSRSSVGA